MNKPKKVLVLFSGGADSTSTAIHYLKKGYKAYLVTFDNGAEINLASSERKAKMIIEKFPKLCSWRMLNSRWLFYEMAIKTLEKDVKKYGNLICCGCKIAMLAHAVAFCKKNGIKIIADGFEKWQTYYPEQTPEYIYVAGLLVKKYGIKNEHPLYDMSSEQIKEITVKAGLSPDPLQAACLFGENRISNPNIKAYTLEKLPLAVKFIESLAPIQQGLIDAGAIQCGYCTSGLVTELFALFTKNINASKDEITDAISRHFCVCTGYETILKGSRLAQKYLKAKN